MHRWQNVNNIIPNIEDSRLVKEKKTDKKTATLLLWLPSFFLQPESKLVIVLN